MNPPDGGPDLRLAPLTTLGVGGAARRLVTCVSADDIVEIVGDCDRRGEPVLVLGGGSNVLIGDAGFAGTVVLIRSRGIDIADLGCGSTPMRVQAGEPWDAVVEASIAAGLAGIECLSAIPGSTGATPVQNVGAYGQEVGDVVARVRTYDRELERIRTFAAADCDFGYRTSRFKRERRPDGGVRYVVLDVEFALRSATLSDPLRYAQLADRLGVALGQRAPLTDVRAGVLALRAEKGMVHASGDPGHPVDPDARSAGSFFTNPLVSSEHAARLPEQAPRWPAPNGLVKVSAAWLIEAAGFERGHTLGAARLSHKHTLALVNDGAATAADIVALARVIRDAVGRRFGVTLEPEPDLIGLRI